MLGYNRIYMGEKPNDSYKDWPPSEMALLFISMYGGIDGEHHKTWVIDQVARILLGTPVKVTTATWTDGTREERFNTGEPSQAYLDWVEAQGGEDTEEGKEYLWDLGIAP